MNGEEFFELLGAGDTARLSAVLEQEPHLAATRDASGLSAVLWSLYNRRPESFAILLANNPPLDVFEAAAAGRVPDVATHIGRDPSSARARAADGFTPLHLAAFFSHLDVAELLVDRGADVRAVAGNASRVEPLHSAAAAGATEIVALLLRAGADPNAVQHGGYTPLHTAASQGNLPIIHALIARGADPTREADDGRTPLGMAGDRAEVAAALRP